VAWQIVPRRLLEWVSQPAGMRAMMPMMKLEIAVLEQAVAR